MDSSGCLLCAVRQIQTKLGALLGQDLYSPSSCNLVLQLQKQPNYNQQHLYLRAMTQNCIYAKKKIEITLIMNQEFAVMGS